MRIKTNCCSVHCNQCFCFRSFSSYGHTVCLHSLSGRGPAHLQFCCRFIVPWNSVGNICAAAATFLYSSKPFSCHFALHICSSFGCLLVVLEFDFCVSYITCNICVPRILIPDSFCSFKSSRTLVMIVG